MGEGCGLQLAVNVETTKATEDQPTHNRVFHLVIQVVKYSIHSYMLSVM